VIVLLAVTLLQAGPLAEGLSAFREGRYEDASRLLSEAMDQAPTYEGLLTLGLAQGHLQRLEEAGSAFDRAIALSPERREAFVERGGLRFLEARYAEACADLTTALKIGDDAYARDLLAASLYLSGRSEQALVEWNRLGKPTLHAIEISGLVLTHDRVARRELSLVEGDVLDVRGLRESQLRLKEVGAFDRVSLRPKPLGDGTADLDVALTERHGFGSSLLGIALDVGVDALSERVRLGYANIGGEGMSVSSQYRWESSRPEISLSLDWPRPFGAGLYLHMHSFIGRQQYALPDGSIEWRGGGGDLVARHVMGSHSVWQVALRTRSRTFSRARMGAPSGTIVGVEAGLDDTLWTTERQRLATTAHVFETVRALGSDVAYTRCLANLKYQILLKAPEGVSIEPSVLAAQLQWGFGSGGMPLDQEFAPGGGPDMELPLRAHPQDQDGVLGVMPIGRSILVGNVEWRRRLFRTPLLQVGAVLFYDGGRIGTTTQNATRDFHDVGVGLRVNIPGAVLVRLDYGRGLTDGAHAFFVGLGQVF
jgi:hypothetical protein